MSDTTTTKKTEFVFRRLADSFDQFTGDVFAAFLANTISLVLLGALALVVLARVAYRLGVPASKGQKTGDAAAMGVVWGALGALAVVAMMHEGGVLLAAINGQTSDTWRLVVAGVAEPVCLAVLAGVGFSLVSFFLPQKSATAAPRDMAALSLALASGLLVGLTAVWWLVGYFHQDMLPAKGGTDSLANAGSGNQLKWLALVGTLFAAGSVFNIFMYIKDCRSAAWYFALPLALLRETVYAILCLVFLLPAVQTWEDTNKQSRVVILLDISPSVTEGTDETTGGIAKKRIDVLIEFLTDEKVAFLKNLLDKNPVAIYAFGTRLDETPAVIGQKEAPWSKGEWDAFRKFDFKPFVLRGLSDDGKAQLRASREWGDGAGTVEWAQTWSARKAAGDLKAVAGLEADADVDTLRKNLEKLDKRIDVARTITLGTNVPDSITAAINRESANMVQGVIVLSDGRSNLGSASSYAELRERATREKIPVFTVTVGEDRERVAVAITDVQAPDSAPIDEAWKVIVEADGTNLANKTTKVFLDLWAPGSDGKPKNVKDATPDDVLELELTFAPGDPPHGQVEFVLDPAKVREEVRAKLTRDSTDAAIQKRVFFDGKWQARARIPYDEKEPQTAEERKNNVQHVSQVREINVVQQKLRILLMAGAPTREFSFLRTLLVREVQDKRATLTTFVQNEAGTTNKLTAEQDETVIPRFPTKFDLSPTPKIDPKDPKAAIEDLPYNLNNYDVLIAFDPDWSELTQQQSEDVERWVRRGGGGVIFVAGPINTFQLARVEEKSRLDPILNLLPVAPADNVLLKNRASKSIPRRLYLNSKAIIGSDLLKLDDKVKDDPVAGWEPFFTDREKYVKNPDEKEERSPKRGFFSCYPLKTDVGIAGVKAGCAVLAEFVDEGDTGETVKLPYLVTNNPSAEYRTCFLAGGEFHRMRAYEPGEGTGREYFERVWFKLIKYMAGKRNIKAPRGRLLVGKEAVSGTPLRVQARILDLTAKPYAPAAISPKFRVIQEPAGGGEKRTFGPFDLAAKTPNTGAAFDGYYAGQVQLDPKVFAPGESVYKIEIDVPDSASGEKLTGEFRIRQADPEMDNKRPDYPAMLRMAGELKELQGRLSDKLKGDLEKVLPQEGGVRRLAFKVSDTESLKLIPECMKTEKRSFENRGPVHDLWDKPLKFTVLGCEVRLLDFELTQNRANGGLLFLAITSLVLLLGRGLWALTVENGGATLRWSINLTIVGAQLIALIVVGVMAALDQSDWWFWLAGAFLFVMQVIAYRGEWGSGLALLGFLTVGAFGMYAVSQYSGFAGASVQTSFVLLAVVTLLSIEWLSRKLLRLA